MVVFFYPKDGSSYCTEVWFSPPVPVLPGLPLFAAGILMSRPWALRRRCAPSETPTTGSKGPTRRWWGSGARELSLRLKRTERRRAPVLAPWVGSSFFPSSLHFSSLRLTSVPVVPVRPLAPLPAAHKASTARRASRSSTASRSPYATMRTAKSGPLTASLERSWAPSRGGPRASRCPAAPSRA